MGNGGIGVRLTLHSSLDLFHSLEDLTESIIDVLAGTVLLEGIDDAESTVDEGTGVLDHVNVGQDEPCL